MLWQQKKARQELLSLANGRANKTANKISEIDKTSHLSQIATVGSNLSVIGEKIATTVKK